MGNTKRPIPFSIDISESDEKLMQTNRATYEVMKKVNLKLRKYAKDNSNVSDASDLFDLTPLHEQIKDYPIFKRKASPNRNMSQALMVLFDYFNSLFNELHYYGILKIRSNYDEYLKYRITLAENEKIMVLNNTGVTFDSYKMKMVPQKNSGPNSRVKKIKDYNLE